MMQQHCRSLLFYSLIIFVILMEGEMGGGVDKCFDTKAVLL